MPPPVRSPSETEADNSSESRSPTPDSPEEVEPEVPAIMTDRLFGWLKKRNSRNGWHKRYFFVDESRGTLAYAKSHKGRGSKPSAVLPLADVTRIETIPHEPNAFVISCPPIHLTVAAVSVKERRNWVRQLEMRMEVWRARQAEKMPVASMETLLSMVHDAPGAEDLGLTGGAGADDHAEDEGGSAVLERIRARKRWESNKGEGSPEDGGSSESASSPSAASEAGSTGSAAPSIASGSRTDLEPRAAVAASPARRYESPSAPIDLSEPTEEEAQRLLTTAVAAPSAAAPSTAAPFAVAAPTFESRRPPPSLAASQPAAAAALSPAGGGGRRPGLSTPENGSSNAVETVELYSGDEDDDDEGDDVSLRVDSANKASGGRNGNGRSRHDSPPMRGPAPVPLAAMISSDEEEEDEENDGNVAAPPRAAQPRITPPKRAAEAGTAQMLPGPEAAVAATALVAPAVVEDLAPPRRRRDAAGTEAAGGAHSAALASAPPSRGAAAPAAVTAVSRARPADDDDDDWDSSDESDDEGAGAVRPVVRSARSVPSEVDAPPPAPVVRKTAAPPARPAPPAEPAVFAAPGIAADEDFAEEDWDDDE